MPDTPIVRPATPADGDTLADFNVAMAAETEGLRLDRDTVRRGAAVVLADATKGRYYVADLDGRAAGCLLVTWEWSDWRNGNIWWVQSVYVRPDARRRGTFRALYDYARRQASVAGAVAIRLYVEQENHAAQASYRRLGMRMTGYKVMQEDLPRG